MTYMGINDEILYLNNNSGVRSEVDALKDDVTALETEIGSDSTTPMTGLELKPMKIVYLLSILL